MTNFKLVCLFSFIATVNCFYSHQNAMDYFNALDSCVSELNLPQDKIQLYRSIGFPANRNESKLFCCLYKKIKWVVDGQFAPNEIRKLIETSFNITQDKTRRRIELTTVDVCENTVQPETNVCSFVNELSYCLDRQIASYNVPFVKEVCIRRLNITKEKFNSYNLEGGLQAIEEKCALACVWKCMQLIDDGAFSKEVAYRRMRTVVPNNSIIFGELKEIIDVCAKGVQTETDECTIAGIVGPCFFKKMNELQARYPDITDDDVTDETSTQRKISKRHISSKFQRKSYHDALLGLFGYFD